MTKISVFYLTEKQKSLYYLNVHGLFSAYRCAAP